MTPRDGRIFQISPNVGLKLVSKFVVQSVAIKFGTPVQSVLYRFLNLDIVFC